MRVCIVTHTDPLEPWPIVRVARELSVLQEQGKEAVVVAWTKRPGPGASAEDVRDGATFVRIHVPVPDGLLGRIRAYSEATRRMAAAIRRLSPDAILAHDLEALRPAQRAARRLGVPLLYHAHEDWPAMVGERSRLEAWIFRRLERRLCRSVAHVYTVGEALGEKYRSWHLPVTVQYAGKPLASIPMVPGPRRAQLRQAWGIGVTDYVVGVAGSLGSDETLGPIFDAVAPLEPTVKVWLVGGLPDRTERAKRLAASKGLAHRVVATGTLPTPSYLEMVGALDVGLALYLPASANTTYNAPLKLFDYMALGVPAIVSDSPEMRRIAVDDCGFGVAVDPTSPDAIRTAIEGLRPAAKRQEMSIRARACFREKYCWEKQRETLVASHPVFSEAG